MGGRNLAGLGSRAGKGKAKTGAHPGNRPSLMLLPGMFLKVPLASSHTCTRAHMCTHMVLLQQPPLSLCMPCHLQHPAWEKAASVKCQELRGGIWRKKTKLGWGLPAVDTAHMGTALGLTSSLPSLQGASLIQGGPRIKCESTPPPTECHHPHSKA